MKNIATILIVLFCCCRTFAQEIPSVRDVPTLHRFRLWNTFDSTQKLTFFAGFTNGLVTGAGIKQCTDNKQSGQALLECIIVNKELSTDQAMAMIDKYYKENPEKWNIPIGDAIVEALTVKGGPCAQMATQK